MNDLLIADLFYVFGPAVARQIRAGAKAIHILLKLLRANQFFMAAIKEISQVVKKLAEIGRTNKALKAELVNSLPKKNVNVFRQQQIKILARALENAKAVGVKCAGPDGSFKTRSFAAQTLFNARLQFGGCIVSEGDRQYFFCFRMPLLNQPGDALYQHRGLTGTSAGQHQHGAVQVLNGTLLPRIGSKYRHLVSCCYYANWRR